jgi:DNA-binding beta-propeller fold protein YncE
MKRTLLCGAALVLCVGTASAQIALSGNDNKQVLENGTVRTLPNPAPDNVTVLDLGVTPPRIVATVAAPHSVVGPPLSVALTPDERLGLATSAQKIDAANPAAITPDNRLSVIDLRANPPAVIQTLEAGAGASGVSVNRAGTLALVANRNAGTVSVFRIADGRLAPVSTVNIGPPASGVSHAQFTPDGRFALVTRDGDFMVSVLRVEGENVTLAGRDITVGIRPYGMGITRDGRWAVVANIGRSSGGEPDLPGRRALPGGRHRDGGCHARGNPGQPRQPPHRGDGDERLQPGTGPPVARPRAGGHAAY